MWWWWTGCVVGIEQFVQIDEPVDRIVVDVTAGDLAVIGREGLVELSGAFGGASGGPISGEVFDGELVVSYTCNFCGGQLTVTAPPNTSLDLVLGAGDLDVQEMTGELVASLVAGEATVLRHGAGSVVVTVEAGAVEASFVEPPASLFSTVSTGNIDVLLPAGPYALDLEADGQLTVDPALLDDVTSEHDVVLRALAGSVRVTVPDL